MFIYNANSHRHDSLPYLLAFYFLQFSSLSDNQGLCNTIIQILLLKHTRIIKIDTTLTMEIFQNMLKSFIKLTVILITKMVLEKN